MLNKVYSKKEMYILTLFYDINHDYLKWKNN